MNKIQIRVANEHVEDLVKAMVDYNPVAVDLPDFLPCGEELKDIEFDLESVTSQFLSKIFFAGVRYGIKVMDASMLKVWE